MLCSIKYFAAYQTSLNELHRDDRSIICSSNELRKKYFHMNIPWATSACTIRRFSVEEKLSGGMPISVKLKRCHRQAWHTFARKHGKVRKLKMFGSDEPKINKVCSDGKRYAWRHLEKTYDPKYASDIKVHIPQRWKCFGHDFVLVKLKDQCLNNMLGETMLAFVKDVGFVKKIFTSQSGSVLDSQSLVRSPKNYLKSTVWQIKRTVWTELNSILLTYCQNLTELIFSRCKLVIQSNYLLLNEWRWLGTLTWY